MVPKEQERGWNHIFNGRHFRTIWFLWGYDDEVQTDGQQGRIGGQVQGKNTAQLKHQRSLGEAQDGSSGDGKDGGRYQVHKNIYGQYNSNCK